jgi:hypothetical protein
MVAAKRQRFAAGLGLAALLMTGGCNGAEKEFAARREQVLATIDLGLASDDPAVRAETIRLVGKLGDPALVDRLIAGLEDPDPGPQAAATEALLRMGRTEAEAAAIAHLVSAPEALRKQTLVIAMTSTREPFREEAVARALGDIATELRLAALSQARLHRVKVEERTLLKLTSDADPMLADAAMQLLGERFPDAASRALIALLRSDDATRHTQGLRLAVYAPSGSIWPLLRSYALFGTEAEQSDALRALAAMGDEAVAERIRKLTLAVGPAEAARTLRAAAGLSSPEVAEQRPLFRKNESLEVRRASFDAMIAARAPLSDWIVFLDDPEVTLVQAAIRQMQRLDSAVATRALVDALAVSAHPERLLRSILVAAEPDTVMVLVQAMGPRLEALVDSENTEISEVAARLLLQDPSRKSLQAKLLASNKPTLTYALLDSTLEQGAGNQAVAARFAQDDLYFVRLGAQLHIWKLGAAYQPAAVN